ncbi:AAA family ATPase [Streptomyces sp. NPDC088923]|uniref:AAA family ATPase n=1 Tax=Streptomyces sp. NPDC088923 TaxID=3365913 RepID=UPI0037FD7228
MRLHRLTVTAFGPFAGTQSVDFDRLAEAGLFLLHGATGAGKSSLLDAVCYALYGVVPGDRQGVSAQGEKLRSDHAAPGTRTSVTLDFTVAGRRLEITRQPPFVRAKKRGTGTTTEKALTTLRAHDPARGWTGLGRTHQEIGEEIKQLLGLSSEQFCQVVLLPQGQFARFLGADTADRALLLRQLFDTRRFFEIETHLRERKAETDEAVRQADSDLLALHHRVAQAAALPRDEAPGQPPAAGDPALPEFVLAHAALARAYARERLDIARLRHQDTEAAHHAASAAYDGVRELAALQRRHAEARVRADALAAREPAHRADLDRLDAGRRAETVAPALDLRASASTAHAEALAAERRLREALPREHAEADAAGLAEAARRQDETRGALTSARRAEERLHALVRERDAIDHEDRADAQARAEDEQWLDAWPARRADLRAHVAAARDAATRTAELTGRAEPVARRLDAARRYEELSADHTRAEAAEASARARRDECRTAWLDAREARLDGIAAELAAQLSPGTPCAVCGATEHPQPARRAARHTDRAAEDAAEAAYRRAETAASEATAHARTLAVRREAAAEAAGEASLAALAAEKAALDRELAAARAEAARLTEALRAEERAEREHTRRAGAREAAATRAAARTSAREALDAEEGRLRAEATEARGGFASVAARAHHLEGLARLLTEAAEAVRAVATTADRLKEADARLADAAFAARFDTPARAAAARLPEHAARELRERTEAHAREAHTVHLALAEHAVAEAAARPPAEPEPAAARVRAAEATARTAASAHDAARSRTTALGSLSATLAARVRELGPLRARHALVSALADLAAGSAKRNERRMRLESYVLAARLEQIAAAATARLARMSQGRYTLVHSDDRAARGKLSGLGLHVVDAWTGRERDTASLSGGETFYVSLALALGLADVVTDEAGGVRLDTLFIDEGFGSLDEQTLDEVMDVLDGLRERERCVGVVSHVGELRRRVPAQLEVVKGRAGSTVRERGF